MSYQSEYNTEIFGQVNNQLPWYTPPKNILSKDL